MKHLKPIVKFLKYGWLTGMFFISWALFRNLWMDNSYLWWPFKQWIQINPFESLFALTVLGFIIGRRLLK